MKGASHTPGRLVDHLARCAAIGGWLVAWLLIAPSAARASEPTAEPMLRLETGMHTAMARRIATDRTGRWAVTASDDKTARVWEVASGRLQAVLRPPQDAGEEGKLFAVALSPDAAVVAVAGWTGWDWVGRNSIYLFDRASTRLLRRIDGLPSVANDLAFSPDGRWLAATLGGGHGVQLFDARGGSERGRDAGYGGGSYNVHFSPDGRRLATTCEDGKLRSYAVDEQGSLRLLKASVPERGKEPFSARFSPDGRRIAVGFYDAPLVLVLDAQTLAEVARPATAGVDNGQMERVAWSADGASLLAGGRWELDGKIAVRRWTVDDWSRHDDVPLGASTLTDAVPLPASAGAGWLFGLATPSWGVLDARAKLVRRVDPKIADLRAQEGEFRVSADGRRVRFGYALYGKEPRIFDVGARVMEADSVAAASALQAARTAAPTFKVTDWRDGYTPLLDGKPLGLKPFEMSRSLAIAPDGRRFALGTEWNLRLFDATGRSLWTRPVPDSVWTLNISADGRFVIAAYGDGTIRWHRLDDDGREVLALFPHADRKRWVAWTPEGYFDASPGAEELIGYHLNQGPDHEGEFVSARQLWETFYQPGLIARRLDADGDRLLADHVKRRGDVRALLKAGRVPELVLESPAEAQTSGTYQLAVRIRNAGQGGGKLVVRVDGVEIAGRWSAPALTPGRVVNMPVDLGDGLRRLTVELVDARGVASKPVAVRIQVTKPAAVAGTTRHLPAQGGPH
jgi:WD40 repeat protein